MAGVVLFFMRVFFFGGGVGAAVGFGAVSLQVITPEAVDTHWNGAWAYFHRILSMCRTVHGDSEETHINRLFLFLLRGQGFRI